MAEQEAAGAAGAVRARFRLALRFSPLRVEGAGGPAPRAAMRALPAALHPLPLRLVLTLVEEAARRRRLALGALDKYAPLRRPRGAPDATADEAGSALEAGRQWPAGEAALAPAEAARFTLIGMEGAAAVATLVAAGAAVGAQEPPLEEAGAHHSSTPRSAFLPGPLHMSMRALHLRLEPLGAP